jgi:hypothetical protein
MLRARQGLALRRRPCAVCEHDALLEGRVFLIPSGKALALVQPGLTLRSGLR